MNTPPAMLDLPANVMEISLTLDHEARRHVRHQYQQGLLLWLRQQSRDGVYLMAEALEQQMCAQAQDASRGVWWLALGLMDCLLFDSLPSSPHVSLTLRQLDQLMSSLTDEAPVLNSLLTLLDQSQGVTSLVLDIKKTYDLQLRLQDQADPELYPVFIEEFNELYPEVTTGLQQLQQQFNVANLQTIQRHLHTLKGSARMSGLMLTGYLLHEMESQLLDWSQQPKQANLATLQQQLSQQLQRLQNPSSAWDQATHQPFASLLPRLQQLAKQTALELHKQTELTLIGGELTLTTESLTKITIILEHLVRNAIVHGIETSSRRLAQGKAAIGSIVIQLSAPQAEHWRLTVRDDGAGLDLRALQQKALSQQIITTQQPLNEKQLAQLIFHPGLSTAKQINQLAGRGVGLDVVAHEVAQLGGSIEVQTRTEHGCWFIIKYPR